MATIKNDELMKNQFLSTTYNRKVRINYDRLRIILTDNINKVYSPNNILNIVLSEIISVASLFLTIFSTSITIEWIKGALVLLCMCASLYYLYNAILWIKESKTVDDILYIIEQDNELDENNSPKKKK